MNLRRGDGNRKRIGAAPAATAAGGVLAAAPLTAAAQDDDLIDDELFEDELIDIDLPDILDDEEVLDPVDVVAVEDIAAAGNGGVAVATADGGFIAIGDLDTGLNEGAAIAVGDVWDGAVAIEGGDVLTTTSLGISADGGVAIADASGGDDNFAFVS